MRGLMIAAAVTVFTATPLFAEDDGGSVPGGGVTASSASAVGGVLRGTPPDLFDIQTELQGLYDEISQATLGFETEDDVDLFHTVAYTPDWVFVDAMGHSQTWTDVRERAIQALSEPPLDSMTQIIRKMSLESDGATVVVAETTVRAIVDHEGRYGRQGASQTLASTTTFRDRWIRVSNQWKMKSREQISGPTVSVDKADRSTN